MRVAIITYDTQHLKTADIFFGLQGRQDLELSFLLAPFSRRAERPVAFAHRPRQFEGAPMRALARHYGLRIWEYEERAEAVAACDYLLIGGANILEPELANCGKIINAHAGLIPTVRGLDAFKWAILNLDPVGNTLHFIDEEADAGSVIHQQITPLFAEDTLESFAYRHYRAEITMLSRFAEYLEDGSRLDLPKREPRMRMPMAREKEMLDGFAAYKERYAIT